MKVIHCGEFPTAHLALHKCYRYEPQYLVPGDEKIATFSACLKGSIGFEPIFAAE
jgi:hypothetical protein